MALGSLRASRNIWRAGAWRQRRQALRELRRLIDYGIVLMHQAQGLLKDVFTAVLAEHIHI